MSSRSCARPSLELGTWRAQGYAAHDATLEEPVLPRIFGPPQRRRLPQLRRRFVSTCGGSLCRAACLLPCSTSSCRRSRSCSGCAAASRRSTGWLRRSRKRRAAAAVRPCRRRRRSRHRRRPPCPRRRRCRATAAAHAAGATQPELHQQIAAAAAAAEYRGEQQPARRRRTRTRRSRRRRSCAAAADGLQLDGLELEEHDAAAADAAAAAAAAAATAGKVDDWLSSDSYGKFIGISTFFNPGRHENKVENFRKFKGAVAAQGLQMLCVELVFGDSTFQLLDASSDAPDCEIMVQRRTSEGNTLWQKERLLNIALDNLPASVTKVMWLDSDLIFLNDDWVPETAELLDQYPVVQPFGWMTYLPADQGSEYGTEKLPTLPLGQGVSGVYHGAGLGVSQFGELCFRANFVIGHPGFAWAARREVITSAGFYDRSIIGGGDRIMLGAFTGHYNGARKMPPMMAEDVRAFGARLRRSSGRRTCRTRVALCCTSGTATAPTATSKPVQHLVGQQVQPGRRRADQRGGRARVGDREAAAPLAGDRVLQQPQGGAEGDEPLARGRRVDGAAQGPLAPRPLLPRLPLQPRGVPPVLQEGLRAVGRGPPRHPAAAEGAPGAAEGGAGGQQGGKKKKKRKASYA